MSQTPRPKAAFRFEALGLRACFGFRISCFEFPLSGGGSAGPVTWNFNKFLIGRDGSVVGRYDSKVEPLSPELIGEIEKALAETS